MQTTLIVNAGKFLLPPDGRAVPNDAQQIDSWLLAVLLILCRRTAFQLGL